MEGGKKSEEAAATHDIIQERKKKGEERRAFSRYLHEEGKVGIGKKREREGGLTSLSSASSPSKKER